MELPDSEQTAKGTRDWQHVPPHRLAQGGVNPQVSRDPTTLEQRFQIRWHRAAFVAAKLTIRPIPKSPWTLKSMRSFRSDWPDWAYGTSGLR